MSVKIGLTEITTLFCCQYSKPKLIREIKYKVCDFYVVVFYFSKGKNHGSEVTSLLTGVLCYPSQYLLFKGENNYTVTLIVDDYVEFNYEMPPLGSLCFVFPPKSSIKEERRKSKQKLGVKKREGDPRQLITLKTCSF